MKKLRKPSFLRRIWAQMKMNLPKIISWLVNFSGFCCSLVTSLLFLRFSSFLTANTDIVPPTDFPYRATIFFWKTHLWVIFPILSVLFIGFHLFCDWKNRDIFSWKWFGFSCLHLLIVAIALTVFLLTFVPAFLKSMNMTVSL